METETVKTVKHTPLPWSYKRTHQLSSDTWYVLIDPSGKGPIVDVGGKDVSGQIAEAKHLTTNHEEIAANAEFIVRACNSHYELLEALKEIMRFKSEMEYIMGNALVTPDNFLKALENAETIIKKATS